MPPTQTSVSKTQIHVAVLGARFRRRFQQGADY
jgi:hypothetical protein